MTSIQFPENSGNILRYRRYGIFGEKIMDKIYKKDDMTWIKVTDQLPKFGHKYRYLFMNGKKRSNLWICL